MKAVGSEVALNNEVGRAMRSEATQPERDQLVQRPLADADRGIRPDAVDRNRRIELGGIDDPYVVETSSGGVLGAQAPGPSVRLDGPHGCVGIPVRQGESDRSVACADVDEVTIAGLGRWALEQEQLGAGVDSVGGEDTPIGGEGEPEVGEDQFDLPPIGADGRVLVEVVGVRALGTGCHGKPTIGV